MYSIKVILGLLFVCCSSSMAMIVNGSPNIITDKNKNFDSTNIKSDLDCSQFGSDFDVLSQFPFDVVINPPNNISNTSYVLTNNQGTHITRLDIHSESTIPLSTFCLTNLTKLAIWNTSFSDGIVPDTLANLNQLSTLMIHESVIVSMTERLGTLSGLETLYLVDCALTHVPNLSALNKLQNLDLAANHLSQVDGITGVTDLWLDTNNFTQMPKIERPENLQYLNMNNNPLQNIAEITSYTSLEELWLHNISLSSVPPTIDRLKKVKILDLSYNKLFYLPNNIFNMANLDQLMIHKNLFSPFDIQALQVEFGKTHPNMSLYVYIPGQDL